MKRFEGKVAVVTGGNSGIGLAAAKRLHDEGAKVAISGRSQKTLDEAVKIIGDGTLAVNADVSKTTDLDRFYKAVADKFGKIDILFVNAGVAKFHALEQSTEDLYNEMFDINVKGAFFTVIKALPHLRDGGSIIFNSSVVDAKGLPAGSIYAATKGAVRSFTRSLAAALVPRNIRVNAVAPGPIETPIFGRTGLPQQQLDEFAADIKERNPMKRFGKPEEIAGAVAFLASTDATYITGVDLNIDGGYGQI
jgi:NAD(P)-dependent dehydrogenase (short-subunit alcohol dehydrogenase family)